MFLKKVSSLQQYDDKIKNQISLYRQHIHILVIDDEDFFYLDNLRRLGYKISKQNDVKSISDIDSYRIVLCDIKGVGVELSKEHQGAFVIREIKKYKPDTVVIAYTASKYDANAHDYLRIADDVINKSTVFDEWVARLDDKIYNLLSPYQLWNKLEQQLKLAGCSKLRMRLVENNFVDSYLTNQSDRLINMNKGIKMDLSTWKTIFDIVSFSVEVINLVKV